MRVRPTAILIVLLCIVGSVAFAQSEDRPRRLEHGETNFYEDGVESGLAPESEYTDRIVRELRRLEPRLGIEVRLSIPVQPRAFTEDGFVEVFNILRGVSTMEGIQYYSASRERMRTFYHESYAVAGPDGDERVADPVVDEIPRESTMYAYQRDSSLGRNVQRLDYHAEDGEVLVHITNLTTMVYTVVPLVAPENLHIFLLIQPNESAGELTFYGNLGVRVPTLLGMRDRARDSFYNRVVALYEWFVGRLERENLIDPARARP